MIALALDILTTTQGVTTVHQKDSLFLFYHIQACPKCMEKDHQCKKGNKIALKSTNLQTQGGATEPEFASMVGLPDAIHVGKSLECFHAK